MQQVAFKRGQEVETIYQCLSSAAGSRSKVVKTRKDTNGSTWVRCNFGKNQGGQSLLKWMPADALKLVQEAA